MADPVFTAKVERALATATPSAADLAAFKEVYEIPNIIISEDAPDDEDGSPENTIYFQV